MISPHLLEIERSICTLSLEEQEWLLERIKRQVQEKKLTAYKSIDKKYMNEQLAAMASDLDTQTEIVDINKEFPITEIDGLEKL
jgi:GTP1/Obg family GTP-binding protein